MARTLRPARHEHTLTKRPPPNRFPTASQPPPNRLQTEREASGHWLPLPCCLPLNTLWPLWWQDPLHLVVQLRLDGSFQPLNGEVACATNGGGSSSTPLKAQVGWEGKAIVTRYKAGHGTAGQVHIEYATRPHRPRFCSSIWPREIPQLHPGRCCCHCVRTSSSHRHSATQPQLSATALSHSFHP